MKDHHLMVWVFFTAVRRRHKAVKIELEWNNWRSLFMCSIESTMLKLIIKKKKTAHMEICLVVQLQTSTVAFSAVNRNKGIREKPNSFYDLPLFNHNRALKQFFFQLCGCVRLLFIFFFPCSCRVSNVTNDELQFLYCG